MVFLAVLAGLAAAAPAGARTGPASSIIRLADGNVCGITAPSAPRAQAGPAGKRVGLIIWFHGGMRSRNREKGAHAQLALVPFLEPDSYCLASPSAFAGEDWLSPQGLEHTEALIDYLIAHFPVDTGDINLAGVSDGCLAVIRYSLEGKRGIRRRVLISAYPQLVVTPQSLAAGKNRIATGSWDFLQGGKDRLFPVAEVIPFLREWEKSFSNSRLHYFPDGEHDFGYYAQKAPELLRNLFSGPGKAGKKPPIQNSQGKN
jgi:pimeloyl-ACP methyl ester carboxylesterase